MYILTKCSSPSWTEEFNTIGSLHDKLEGVVCQGCKINTFEEMKRSFENNQLIGDFTDEDVMDELKHCSISEDYEKLTIEEQVDELLGTACGREYQLEEK